MESSSAREIWDAALGDLQVQVSKPNYRTWLEKTIGLDYRDNRFTVSVPNTFVAEYLDKNQRSLIEKTLITLTSSPEIAITFQVDGRNNNSFSPGQRGGSPPTITAPRLNSGYVFDSFAVGSSNLLAHATALGVAQNPGLIYNPLYICGGSGMGKTHLLHAIGHLVLARQVPVLCVSAEQFTNEFIRSVREGKTDEFQSKYRNCGTLLIDDIHFLSGKKQTEESFCHTFNALHAANRQIVITSDQSPAMLTALDKRLRTRFAWGLVVDIQPPDFETRLAILQKKPKATGLSAEVLEFIARREHPNVRVLEGSLNRVIAYSQLFRAAPTVDLATRALEDLGSKAPSDPTPASALIEAAAACFQLSPEDLVGRRRDKEISLARRAAMYLLRRETSSSLAQIGAHLGGRDPSSVAGACKMMESELRDNPKLRRKLKEIQKRAKNVPNHQD
jgi:chromosomal replication initiator protein